MVPNVRSGSRLGQIKKHSVCIPLCPRTRTLLDAVGMSQRCQYQKSGTSFDHLVGTHEQR
jgi:hypothetical protein